MSTAVSLEEALELALKLAPKERLQLIERVASSIERDIDAAPSAVGQAKTGAEIVAMLEAMDPIEFVDPEIEDPVEWVKAQRRKRADRLKPYRDSDQ